MRPSLLRNNGDGTFTDVTERGRAARPGQLELRRAGPITTTTASSTCSSAASSQPNRLYRNKGDGTFEEVAAKAGVAGRRPAAARAPPGSTTTTTAIPTCSSTTSTGPPSCSTTTATARSPTSPTQMGIDGPDARLLVLGLGLRQRRLARHLRHLLRPHAGRRGQGLARPTARARTRTSSTATWRARASRT